MSPTDADLVILGGGCAGLSLAARLADAGAHGPRVVVVEPRLAYVDDRSWCFWSTADSPLARLASAAWDGWSLSTAQGAATLQRAPGLAYRYVRGADFHADALARIAATRSRVTLLQGVSAGGVRGGAGASWWRPRAVRCTVAKWSIRARPRRRRAR